MVKFSTLLLTLLLGGAAAFAHAPKTASPSPKADPALLEFLGSWQTSDGKWLDPMTFARIDPDKLAAEHAHHGGKPVPPSKAGGPGSTPPASDESHDVWHAG